MLNLLVLFFLLIGIYSGARRGLAMQLFYTVGYIISLIVAGAFYKGLGEFITMWVPYPQVSQTSKLVYFTLEQAFSLDAAFYAGFAFLLIFFAGWLLTRLIGIFAHGLTFKKIAGSKDWIIAGVLGGLMMWMILAMIFNLLSVIPLDLIQNALKDSGTARSILEHTPFISSHVHKLWITDIIK